LAVVIMDDDDDSESSESWKLGPDSQHYPIQMAIGVRRATTPMFSIPIDALLVMQLRRWVGTDAKLLESVGGKHISTDPQ
jgi:hypothetical protein